MSPEPTALRVGAVVLAAGRSVRMGQRNKLLAPLEGVAVVRRAVDAIVASGARPVCVVTGHEAARIGDALAGCPVELVHNPDHEAGMSTSLRVGIEAVAGRVEGALVCLADMPWVTPATLDALIGAFRAARGRAVCAPVFAGRRGNPVLWPAARFRELAALRGDAGARAILEAGPPERRDVPAPDDGVLRDVDTPEALRPRAGPQ